MVVEDIDLYEVREYEPEVVARQALTYQPLVVLDDGSVVLARSTNGRRDWPVSGDATTRAGSVVHRRARLYAIPLDLRRAVLDGRLAPLPTAGDYCGHGPMDACLCTVNP